MNTNQPLNDPSAKARTILVAGESAETLALLRACAEARGCKLVTAQDGASALLAASRVRPSLIILGAELAKIRWIDFYTFIRHDAALALTPILLLTNNTEDVDKLPDWGLPNIDFSNKPCTQQELMLRMRRLLNAGKPADTAAETLTLGELTLNVARHEVTVGGDEVRLTLTEFKLLTTLAKSRGRVQSRSRLLQDAFDYNTSVIQTRTVDTHMRRLRLKLGPVGPHLETVRGVGYRFTEKPNPQEKAAAAPIVRATNRVNQVFTNVTRQGRHCAALA
jgi:DNA-binding response OmpR family regulator